MELEQLEVGDINIPADYDKNQKYNFRRSSVIKRIRVEEKQKRPKGSKVKPIQKPQPLSKYRRKSANARERERINDMNLAYEQLRLALPQMTDSDTKGKLPKQTILTLALNYIIALRGALGYQNGSSSRSNSSTPTGLGSDGENSNSSTTGTCSSGDESNPCSSQSCSGDLQGQ